MGSKYKNGAIFYMDQSLVSDFHKLEHLFFSPTTSLLVKSLLRDRRYTYCIGSLRSTLVLI